MNHMERSHMSQPPPLSYEEARVSFGASPDLQPASFNGSGPASLRHAGDEPLQIVSNGSDHLHLPVSSSYSHPDSDDESTSPSVADQIGADGKKAKRPGFIETLYVMVHTPENDLGIGFGSDGLALEVRNTSFFSSNVLPKHFKHKNVSSFIRQLNNYGFRTIPSSKGVFQTFLHDNFRKDRKDLIRNIARRSNAVVKKKKTLFEQVTEYKQRDIERRQRIEELESTDIQKSQYIGELEARLRAVTEERDSLVVENQRLIMMLSTKDMNMRPPPHATSHAHGSIRPGEHSHAQIGAHAMGGHAHYVQQQNRHPVPGPPHPHAHHIPQQPRHSPPGANMHQQPSPYHHQPSPQNQAWPPNQQHGSHHHHQAPPQSLFEPVSGPSRYDPAPSSNENVVDWFRLI